MAHPVFFRSGKRYDKLCAGDLVLYAEGFRPDDCAFDGQLFAPYVLFSILAGEFSDKWDKKVTMLISDTVAALTTVGMLFLLYGGALRIWHLYLINGINGLMNTVQQPASEVATT